MSKAPAPCRITRATEAQADTVTQLMDLQNLFHAELLPEIIKRVPRPEIHTWCLAQLRDSETRIFLAITRDGEACGLLSLINKAYADTQTFHPVNLAFVDELFVTAPQRGHGIGKALIAAAEADAKSRGLNALSLNVWGRNHAAIKAYMALGFDTVYQRMTRVIDPD